MIKNIVCPVSKEKIQENQPRIVATFVALLLLSYILTGFFPILLFLCYDFFMRGFNKGKYSLILFLSKLIAGKYFSFGKLIDKAPKMFAARLGGVMSLLIVVLHVAHFMTGASLVAGVVVVLSASECVLNICVGCYVYSWFVLPFFSVSGKN
jgi:hypothetical protein